MPLDSKLRAFFGKYPIHTYQKGEVLIHAGDTPSAYYLLSGGVMQYDIAKNGTKLTLNTYKAGAFIPLASIVNGIPAQFFFETTEQTSAHIAPASSVASFLQQNPEVTYDALARLSRGGEGLMLRLARAMEGNAEERILQELAIMKRRFFKDSQAVTVTETDLAAKTGLARETVSRTLTRLRAKGLIHTHRGTITLSESLDN